MINTPEYCFKLINVNLGLLIIFLEIFKYFYIFLITRYKNLYYYYNH